MKENEKQIDDGGPAYPAEGGVDSGLHAHPGMSLRDYFAAKAMHAELNTAGMEHEAAVALRCGASDHGHTIEQHIAFNAYNVADAMLAQREKGAQK